MTDSLEIQNNSTDTNDIGAEVYDNMQKYEEYMQKADFLNADLVAGYIVDDLSALFTSDIRTRFLGRNLAGQEDSNYSTALNDEDNINATKRVLVSVLSQDNDRVLRSTKHRLLYDLTTFINGDKNELPGRRNYLDFIKDVEGSQREWILRAFESFFRESNEDIKEYIPNVNEDPLHLRHMEPLYVKVKLQNELNELAANLHDDDKDEIKNRLLELANLEVEGLAGLNIDRNQLVRTVIPIYRVTNILRGFNEKFKTTEGSLMENLTLRIDKLEKDRNSLRVRFGRNRGQIDVELQELIAIRQQYAVLTTDLTNMLIQWANENGCKKLFDKLKFIHNYGSIISKSSDVYYYIHNLEKGFLVIGDLDEREEFIDEVEKLRNLLIFTEPTYKLDQLDSRIRSERKQIEDRRRDNALETLRMAKFSDEDLENIKKRFLYGSNNELVDTQTLLRLDASGEEGLANELRIRKLKYDLGFIDLQTTSAVAAEASEDHQDYSEDRHGIYNHGFVVIDGVSTANGEKAAIITKEHWEETYYSAFGNSLIAPTIDEAKKLLTDFALTVAQKVSIESNEGAAVGTFNIYARDDQNQIKLVTLHIGDTRLHRFPRAHDDAPDGVDMLTADENKDNVYKLPFSPDDIDPEHLEKNRQKVQELMRAYSKNGNVRADEPLRNVVTNKIGGDEPDLVINQLFETQLNDGDILMMASDGITDAVSIQTQRAIIDHAMKLHREYKLNETAMIAVIAKWMLIAAELVINPKASRRDFPADITIIPLIAKEDDKTVIIQSYRSQDEKRKLDRNELIDLMDVLSHSTYYSKEWVQEVLGIEDLNDEGELKAALLKTGLGFEEEGEVIESESQIPSLKPVGEVESDEVNPSSTQVQGSQPVQVPGEVEEPAQSAAALDLSGYQYSDPTVKRLLKEGNIPMDVIAKVFPPEEYDPYEYTSNDMIVNVISNLEAEGIAINSENLQIIADIVRDRMNSDSNQKLRLNDLINEVKTAIDNSSAASQDGEQ